MRAVGRAEAKPLWLVCTSTNELPGCERYPSPTRLPAADTNRRMDSEDVATLAVGRLRQEGDRSEAMYRSSGRAQGTSSSTRVLFSIIREQLRNIFDFGGYTGLQGVPKKRHDFSHAIPTTIDGNDCTLGMLFRISVDYFN